MELVDGDRVNVTVPKHTFSVGIIGDSGVGKTVMLEMFTDDIDEKRGYSATMGVAIEGGPRLVRHAIVKTQHRLEKGEHHTRAQFAHESGSPKNSMRNTVTH